MKSHHKQKPRGQAGLGQSCTGTRNTLLPSIPKNINNPKTLLRFAEHCRNIAYCYRIDAGIAEERSELLEDFAYQLKVRAGRLATGEE